MVHEWLELNKRRIESRRAQTLTRERAFMWPGAPRSRLAQPVNRYEIPAGRRIQDVLSRMHRTTLTWADIPAR